MKTRVGTLSALAITLFITGCAGSTVPPEVQRVHYGDWETDIGYTQVVRVGDMLHLSGVVAGGETMEAQVIAVYKTISAILADFDATLDDVISEVVYTTDIEALKKATMTRRDQFNDAFPASSWIQIERLYMPEALVEVEVSVLVSK